MQSIDLNKLDTKMLENILMFDSIASKVGMNAVVALISAMLLTSAITVAPTVTRVW